MSDKTQKQEIQMAQKEKRIPKCMSCEHELHSIMVTQHDYIDWKYDKASKNYVKGEYDGDSDAPVHDCDECVCEYKNWYFLDDNSESNLGVSF